jgi:hypothetical protein
MPASSSTPYPNVGQYKGRTGLSPPARLPLHTTSTLSVIVLASTRNFHLYQESSTRTSVTRTNNEPAKYNDKDKSLRKVIPKEYHDFLTQSGNPTVEVQAKGSRYRQIRYSSYSADSGRHTLRKRGGQFHRSPPLALTHSLF